jgi:hypothetical protein
MAPLIYAESWVLRHVALSRLNNWYNDQNIQVHISIVMPLSKLQRTVEGLKGRGQFINWRIIPL